MVAPILYADSADDPNDLAYNVPSDAAAPKTLPNTIFGTIWPKFCITCPPRLLSVSNEFFSNFSNLVTPFWSFSLSLKFVLNQLVVLSSIISLMFSSIDQSFQSCVPSFSIFGSLNFVGENKMLWIVSSNLDFFTSFPASFNFSLVQVLLPSFNNKYAECNASSTFSKLFATPLEIL